MENSDNSKKLQNVLEDYIHQLKVQKDNFVLYRVLTTILLCGIAVLVFLCFSVKFDNENYHLDANGTNLLWVIVALVALSFLWLVVKSSLQLKQYRKDIRTLELLLLRAKIQPTGAEEEICTVLKSYYETEQKSDAPERNKRGSGETSPFEP